VARFVTPGNHDSGDLEIVQPYDGGIVIGVIDGIGHGSEAASAAAVARDAIAQHPQDSPIALVVRCHEALRLTRGVVLSIASIDLRHASLRWLGIGNVSAIVQRGAAAVLPSREELLLRAGVIGAAELPTLQTSVIPLRPLDTLIFASDGVRPQFADGPVMTGSLQSVADGILAEYGQGNDDALVLVARAS
jgi:serine phosphatase RsbU (regulator of sigma subunit)